MPRWGSPDDAKLITLWRTPHNGVDHTKLDVNSVKAVHGKYFAAFNYRNFSALYRTKARAFAVSLTLDGHRKRSAAAKSDSIAKGVPLEDISDDDEDQYSDNEEEDIDLEVDSDTDNKSDKDDVESNKEDVESNEDDFESHEEIKKMPPKKVTPKKVEVKQKSITDQMSALNISKTPMFSM